MQKNVLPHRFVGMACVLWASICSLGTSAWAESPPTPPVAETANFSDSLSYEMYTILAAEMYASQGDALTAAQYYAKLASQTKDIAIVKRAAELAIQARDQAIADTVLEAWVRLEPNSADARQYRALNNVRNGKLDHVVEDLIFVRDDVEKREGHGFEFIVSLLMLDSQSEHAYEAFKRYVETADNTPRAQLILAAMALNGKQYDSVITAANVAKQSGDEAQKLQAARLIAKALVGLKKLDEAIAELEPLVKTSTNTELKLDYARLLMANDRGQEATPLFKQLYAVQPDNTEVLYALTILYLEQKEFAFAEPLIKKLEQIPEYAADGHYFMGQVHEANQRVEDAIGAYESALDGTFGSEAINKSVELLVAKKGIDAARNWLTLQAEKQQDQQKKVRFYLIEAQLLDDRQDYKAALVVLNNALKVAPDNTDLLYARALSREHAQDLAGAEADLQAALKIKQDDPTYLNALGYMLVEHTQRYAEAAALIDQALAARPDDPAIMDSKGWVAFKNNQLDDAETWLRKAYAAFPDPEIAGHLIELLVKTGNAVEAKSLLQQMLEKHPDDNQLKQLKTKFTDL